LKTYRHRTTPGFREAYKSLPEDVRKLADEQFQLLKKDPQHNSLQFKKVKGTKNDWSVRVSRGYRALATCFGSDMVWNWIGDHTAYRRRIP